MKATEAPQPLMKYILSIKNTRRLDQTDLQRVVRALGLEADLDSVGSMIDALASHYGCSELAADWRTNFTDVTTKEPDGITGDPFAEAAVPIRSLSA